MYKCLNWVLAKNIHDFVLNFFIVTLGENIVCNPLFSESTELIWSKLLIKIPDQILLNSKFVLDSIVLFFSQKAISNNYAVKVLFPEYFSISRKSCICWTMYGAVQKYNDYKTLNC